MIFKISSDRTADQRLCFRYIDITAPIRNFKHQTIFYMAVQPGLCLTWSENPKTCFVVTWLIYQSGVIITYTYTMSHFTRKLAFCMCKNQEQISLPAQADHYLFRSLDSIISCFQLPKKFQASSILLWLGRLVCVWHGRKPCREVSRGMAYIISGQLFLI